MKNLPFLDLKIILKNNKLLTTVYSKPTGSKMYLHADSIHPESTFTDIQKGVSLRLRRICSTDEEFNERSKEYKAYIFARGHNPASVLKEFDKTANLNRIQARVKRSDNRDKPKRLTTFVVEYNPRGANIQEIIKRHLNVLQENPEVKKIFPDGSIIVANKHCKNQKELSARADPYEVREDLRLRVGSTIKWKTRLANYKSHIKKRIKKPCRIIKHLMNTCVDPDIPS